MLVFPRPGLAGLGSAEVSYFSHPDEMGFPHSKKKVPTLWLRFGRLLMDVYKFRSQLTLFKIKVFYGTFILLANTKIESK